MYVHRFMSLFSFPPFFFPALVFLFFVWDCFFPRHTTKFMCQLLVSLFCVRSCGMHRCVPPVLVCFLFLVLLYSVLFCVVWVVLCSFPDVQKIMCQFPVLVVLRQIFLRGARESTDDVSFLYHSLGSLELTAMRLEDARTAFVEGIGR